MDELKKVGDMGYIRWLFELNKDSGQIAGGKGANLAEIFNSGLPVPPAFVITTNAYYHFLDSAKLTPKINSLLNSINVDNTAELEEKALEIRKIISSAEMPDDLKNEVLEAYEDLSIDKKTLSMAKSDALHILKNLHQKSFVAVRSSATTEDLAGASFAGQQETYLNIKGDKEIIEAVKKVFASLFTARAIYYRKKKGFSKEKFALAAVVQKMVDSDKSGVMFSKNPVESNNNIVIEAVFGLGEGIVSGRIKPDTYEVSEELKIISKKISQKKIAITRNSNGENIDVRLTEERGNEQVLTESEIKSLANLAIKIEEHYGKPQDIEFALEKGEIYIVQTRPITTSVKKKQGEVHGEPILHGLAASPGIASGAVKIVHSINELSKVKKGDILVTKMTNPDMVVTMQKSSAIVTDEGGLTCHASIVSREMGIPAVVGTGNATNLLKDEQIITVDGFRGKVYSGKAEAVESEVKPIVATKTKIKVMVDLPEAAERAAKTQAKSIGLLRLEGIIASNGKHPHFYLKNNILEEYSEMLAEGILKISEKFKEIWIRTSDIRSDEYSALEGAPKNIEINPMLGMHGIRFSLKNPKLLEAEFRAVKKCVLKHSDKIFGVMMPQIISANEISEAKKIAKNVGLIGLSNVRIGIMVETPAACLIIKDLLKEGIDFVSFGTNDLTQYTLAIDRGNESVQYLYNELHPAVLNAIKRVIRTCKEMEVESSICGQAGSNKEMVKFLVENEINSISVNADAAFTISSYVAELEKNGNTENKSAENIYKKNEKNNQQKNRFDSRYENKFSSKHEKNPEKLVEEIEEEISKEISNAEFTEEAGCSEQSAEPQQFSKKLNAPSYVASNTEFKHHDDAYEMAALKALFGEGESKEMQIPKSESSLKDDELDEVLDIF